MARVRTILVVDDEEAIRAFAGASILHGLGERYRVIYAKNGEEALQAVAAARPDLVLLDIAMPGMDGFEVCRRLKASPGTRQVPIIFLTARGEDESVEAGLQAGGDGYIIKPFNAVTLTAQISEMLAPRETR